MKFNKCNQLVLKPCEEVVVHGKIDYIIYQNKDNGYTVASLADVTTGQTVKIVGDLPEVKIGEEVKITGTTFTNTRYGGSVDLKITGVEVVFPRDSIGIATYLSSGIVPNVGPQLARAIVDKFGDDTFRVIDEEPERLASVKGVGKRRVGALIESLTQAVGVRKIMVYLYGLGVGAGTAKAIYEAYGKNAIEKIDENPYCLINLSNIGFKKADQVARSNGVLPDDPNRIAAGIEYALEESESQGHCFLYLSQLMRSVRKILSIPDDKIVSRIDGMVEDGSVVLVGDNGDRAVYSGSMYGAEMQTALDVLRRTGDVPAVDHMTHEDVCNIAGIDLTDEQYAAVVACFESKVSVITGGPGVGKTATIKAIISNASMSMYDVYLAAPTGRAAKRMEQSTGVEAKTIHRLLGYSPNGGWGAELDPYDNALIVIDESSMMDIWLFWRLLKCVTDTCLIVLVGDVDQLPSVGPGRVLGDIIDSGRVPVTRLTKIFRQSMTSMIIGNAHRCNIGKPMVFSPGVGQDHDMEFREALEPAQIPEVVVDAVRDLQGVGYDPYNDIQVFTPMHKGSAGTEVLNITMQQTFNPSGEVAVFRKDTPLLVGDRVIQTKNDYTINVFNGDVGSVVEVVTENVGGKKERIVRVQMQDSIVSYTQDATKNLFLAYAITVHKGQGGEVPAIVVVMHTTHSIMLSRALLYTAVTRGSQRVIIVGTKEALDRATQNNIQATRNTRLDQLLAGIDGDVR